MLVAAYPNWKPSEESLDLYESLLLPLPADAVKEATIRLIQSDREFAPPVGAIIGEAAKCALQEAGVMRLTAEEAWGMVMGRITSRGYYQGPGNLRGYPAVTRAIDAIGWAELCTNENIEANRAHFMRIFNSFKERELRTAIDNLSAGLAVGYEPEKPKLTNNPELNALVRQVARA